MKLLSPIYLVLLPLICNGQITFQNNTLITPDSNVLYVGIDNHYKITGLKSYSDLKLAFNKNETVIDQEGNGIITIGDTGDITLKLYKGNKLLSSRIYNSRLIPPTLLKLGPYSDTTIAFNQIKANNYLHLYLHNCLAKFKLNLKVFSFQLDLLTKDNSVISSYNIDGSKIPDDVLKMIKEMQSGEKLYFKSARTNVHHDRFPPFYIYIK